MVDQLPRDDLDPRILRVTLDELVQLEALQLVRLNQGSAECGTPPTINSVPGGTLIWNVSGSIGKFSRVLEKLNSVLD